MDGESSERRVVVARTDTSDDSDWPTDACTDCGGEVDDLACVGEALNEDPIGEDT